jgi:peptidoglycan endopeptidase LytE
MTCKHLFALIFGIIILSLSTAVARAQDEFEAPDNTGTTSVEVNEEGTRPRLVSDPVIISEAPPSRSLTNRPSPFEQMMLTAIDSRLGSPYVYGSEGPRTFDCSGFVWSVYQQLGVSFERGSARTLWSRMEPVPSGQQYQLGTLVFFSGLTHVGIVADANGFYHASRHHGVVYAPFNKYWLARVDGFRRVNSQTAKLSHTVSR